MASSAATKCSSLRLPFLALLLLVMATATARAQVDEYGYLEKYPWFSHGTFNIFASYVALISVCVGQYRQAAQLNEYWSQSEDLIVEARKAISRGCLEAIFIFLILTVAIAVMVPLLTTPLDPRMDYIIEAISRLTAALLMGMLSIRVAIWVDLYGHPFWNPVTVFQKNLGTSAMELRHRVRWSICKRILRLWFLLFLFFQNADAATIPVSIICGLALGFFVDFCIYLSHRWNSYWRKTCISIAVVAACMLFSILLFSNGVMYIAAVWENNISDVYESTWDVWALLVGILLLPLIHISVWLLGRRNRVVMEEEKEQDPSGEEEEGAAKNSGKSRPTLSRPRMATSMIFSDLNIMKKMKEREAQQAKNSSDPDEKIMEGIQEGGEGEDDDDDDANNEKTLPEAPLPTNLEEETTDKNNLAIPPGPEPTQKELCMDFKLCGCARGEDKSIFLKIANIINWTLYLVICALCLFGFITNAGATYQQQWTKEKLPQVGELLYNNIELGPVCAYDPTRGKQDPPTTFPDKDAAHLANFSILHCGACAACSDWHNLELEYTTRKFLAEEGKNCAKKSLFGGGYDSLVECLEEDWRIGWEGTCAVCWADDIICTKDHCAFIGLQSFFINTLSNFEVTENTITSATCEEAHCEAGNNGHPAKSYTPYYGVFVGCSGANRRRMNVKSDIVRPKNQQCGIVDVNWDDMFPDLHSNDPRCPEDPLCLPKPADDPRCPDDAGCVDQGDLPDPGQS